MFMNLKYRAIAALPLLSAIVFACADGSILDTRYSETEAGAGFEPARIEVPGASFHADKAVCDTFVVTSNRSWSLAPAEEASWLEIHHEPGINLGKVTQKWPVSLVFADNFFEQDRNVDLSLTIDGDSFLIPVCQKAFAPVLELESSLSGTDAVADTGAELALSVRSNCRWRASLDASSDAEVEISPSEGYKSDSLHLHVKPNGDLYSGKTATVVLSAEGVEDVRIDIAQKACVSYLSIDRELSRTDVLPAAGETKVVFSTNDRWTAHLADGAPAEVSLSVEGGEPGDSLHVVFPDASLDRELSATVVITTDKDGLQDSLTFTQRPCKLISFRKYPDNNGGGAKNSPLKNVLTGKDDVAQKENNYLDAPVEDWVGTDADGYQYSFYIGRENTTFHSYQCGLVIGSRAVNPAFHIEFPAIEGKRLKEVKLMLGNSDVKLKNQEKTATGVKGFITDAEGNVVEGGQVQKVETYKPDAYWQDMQLIPSFSTDYCNHPESMFHFVLEGTVENTPYRYAGEYRQVIRWFILYYE